MFTPVAGCSSPSGANPACQSPGRGTRQFSPPASDEPAQETTPESRNNQPTEEIQGAEPNKRTTKTPVRTRQQDPEPESNP
jgi:hypothetical protein